MADTTNPQIVTFTRRARELSNLLTKAYFALQAYNADYAAQGIAGLLDNVDGSEKIADGYATTGVYPVTGTAMVNFKAATTAVQTSFETAVAGVGVPVTTLQNQLHTGNFPV